MTVNALTLRQIRGSLMHRRTFLAGTAAAGCSAFAPPFIRRAFPEQNRAAGPRYPEIPHPRRLEMLAPPTGKVELVFDTDTNNEIDDQFALGYALLSQDRLDIKAVCAAPFQNSRSRDARDGMQQSFEEIGRVQQTLPKSRRVPAYRGSRQFLSSQTEPVRSPAADVIIELARAARDKPLYVSAVGGLTNVASAILLEPAVIQNIVVVWTSAYPHTWHRPNKSFNMEQDLHATRVVLNSGVPLVYLPGYYVGEELRVTLPEIREYVRGRGALGDYLYRIYEQYRDDHFGRSHILWDLINMAWLIEPSWVPSDIFHTPELHDDLHWGPQDETRPVMREAYDVDRDAVFTDFYRKLQRLALEGGRPAEDE